MEVGGREGVVCGGRFDEEAAPVGKGQGGGQLVAEAARRGDGIRNGGAEGGFEAGPQRGGDVGPSQTADGREHRHGGNSQRGG